jgi:hypothetical protein
MEMNTLEELCIFGLYRNTTVSGKLTCSQNDTITLQHI